MQEEKLDLIRAELTRTTAGVARIEGQLGEALSRTNRELDGVHNRMDRLEQRLHRRVTAIGSSVAAGVALAVETARRFFHG